jgi:hypothetical protein
MAVKRKPTEVPETPLRQADVELGRIARLLGLIATKDLSLIEQVGRLRALGFANVEIADILGITSNHVGVALHDYKSKSKRPGQSKAGSKK